MRCAWQELLAVLPMWMRKDVDRLGEENLREIRMRIDARPELVMNGGSCWLGCRVSRDDLNFTVNAASRYSPWTAASAAMGYITVKGGHRIGLCGETLMREGALSGIRSYDSLCIRVARDFRGIASGLEKVNGSILILGPPGWGKTTLLRDLIRCVAEKERVSVVDERGELFPDGFEKGKRTDVLAGCPKKTGIFMLLKTMGPSCIAVDEITDQNDAQALLEAAGCGVRLLATAHGGSVCSLQRRSVYSQLVENRVFDVVLILNKDQSYRMERLTEWDINC